MTLALAALVAVAVSAVQLEPPALALGGDPEAELVLVVPGAKSVVASSANGVGAVSAAEPIGVGRFRARFTFPKERFPQLALLRLEIEEEGGAKSRQWVSLPLIANADLKIETKPRATVTVTIGEKTFGPAVADARGKVKIAAAVPPGFPTATVLAVDRAGNRTTRPLDLMARPFPRAAGALATGEAIAGQRTQLEIFAVEADGRPLPNGGALRLSAKLGSCEAAAARSGGVFVANYRAPTSFKAGPDLITIGIEGTPSTTQLEVAVRPGPPASLVLSFSPPVYRAGSGIAPRLRIEAVDAHGNPVALDQPQLATDFGRIEATAEGRVLRVPDQFGGRSQVKVTATGKDVRGEATLALVAGAPAQAELTFPSHLAGGETAQGQLVLTDRFGNPVEGAPVAAKLATGRSARISEVGKGRYDVSLVTEAGDPIGEHGLAVTAGGKPLTQASLIVRHPQRPWAISVGVLGFLQTNFSQWVSGGPRLLLGLRLGQSGLEVAAEGVFGAYAPIRRPRSTDGQPYDLELQQFSILAGARYWIPFGVRGSFHLSVVGGAQRTSSSVFSLTAPGVTFSQASWGPVFRGGGGIAFYVGIGRALAQLEFTFAPSSGLVRGNLGGGGLALGYLISF